MEAKPRRTLSSLNTSLDVLEVLGASSRPLSLAEITRRMGKSKAALHAILANLEARGYVQRADGGSAFALGLRLWELGTIAGERIDLRRLARPVLRELTARTGENSQVAIYRSPGEVQYLERAFSPNSVQVIVEVGDRAPAYCIAIGRALLAFQGPDEIDLALSGDLVKHSSNTITDPVAIRNELDLVRRTGYSITAGEYRGEIVGVAAPVRDLSGKVVAAVSVYAPEYRFPVARAASCREVTVEAANEISAKLGFSGADRSSAGISGEGL